MFDTMIPTQDLHTSQTRINLGTEEVTITIHDRLQSRDKIRRLRISAINLDQIHLIIQCLTGLEIETRATIHPTTRNSQLPTTVTSQT